MAEDDCFNNPDVDGESTTCEAPENTGCYKALVGTEKNNRIVISYRHLIFSIYVFQNEMIM